MNQFVFKQNEEKPKQREQQTKRLELCLCPLCINGIGHEGNTQMISWIYIMRVILYSLTKLYPSIEYFTLKKDIYGYVNTHWHIFGKLRQFTDKPNKWKKAFLDALSHSPYFESGINLYRTTGYWKLMLNSNPWETSPLNSFNICYSKDELQFMSQNKTVLFMDVSSRKRQVEPQTSLYEIQMNLRDSYVKLYDHHQKLMKYYDNELQTNISWDNKITLLNKINSLKNISRALCELLNSSEETEKAFRQQQASMKQFSGCLFFNVID